jgi:signal transduction histidine kinase
VEVEDNGPGIPAGTLEKIAGVDAFGGTKRHYALPTRDT